MSIGRLTAIALWLCFAVPAAAQTNDEAVVTGSTEKMSDWKRAESEHIVIFSDGSEAELKRVTNNIERLYQLMSRIYRKGGAADDTQPLQVTLIGSSLRFRAMNLRNVRAGEGPYQAAFASQRYYDPREDGAVLAVPRDDQIINLNTNRRYNEDCDAYQAEGGIGFCGNTVPRYYPLVRSWEAVLYSSFAQHFILTHMPAAYPRWYLDGVGALFSSMTVRGDGSLDYAITPPGYADVIKSYGRLFVADVLTGQYLGPERRTLNWTPYHAGLLAHFFLFSDRGARWNAQFVRYMTAIHQGVPMAEAAGAFGNMRQLQRDFAHYIDRPTAYARAKPPQQPFADPIVVTLPASGAALIEARLELGAAPAAAPEASAADWPRQLRAEIARAPYNRDAMVLLAEMECRESHGEACLDAAETVLAKAPDDVRALTWKGAALTGRALSGDPASRAATLAAARALLERAIDLDGRASQPRIAYFQSFVKAGEPVPDKAMAGMARVVRNSPGAPAPRLYLGEELVRRGQADLARRVLYPVLYGGYDLPERTVAERLFQSSSDRVPPKG